MKKYILLLIVTASLVLTGCFKKDTMEGITIYTTAYPIEYITNVLYGENATIKSIYPAGVKITDYKLSNKQIKDYSKSDLFIFNGLSDEKDYVFKFVDNNKRLKIINASLTLEYNNSVEEIWLDPSNFLKIAQNIRTGLNEYIDSYYLKEQIDEKYEKLKLEVSELDAKLNLIKESSTNPTIVVSSDIWKFLEKYNFTVISLEENNNLSDKTVNDTINMIKNKEITYIFTNEGEKISETVNKIVKETGVSTLKIHTLSNITDNEVSNNYDYIKLMNKNLEIFKQELYK